MSEENILAGGIETLYTMKENLLELEGYKSRSTELAKEEERLEKAVEAKEKAISDEITEVTKKRKDEIEESFEEQISKTKARLKKVKSKKDKRKDAKVTERITIETSELVEERRQLNEEIKSLFRTNHVSRIFCNRFYFSLFLPRSIKDMLVIILTLLICFLAIPIGVDKFFLPEENMWLVLTYFILVIIFGGIYLWVNHTTKEKHQDMVRQVRELRNKLAVNAKQIKTIEKGIKRDKDESAYDLDKFNNEIAELEEEVNRMVEEKKEALVIFETTTKYVITEEIKNRQKEELDLLKAEHERVYEEQRVAEEKAKQYSLEISNKYESFVGKENMSLSKIDRLIELVESGEVSKVADAIAVSEKAGSQKSDTKEATIKETTIKENVIKEDNADV